MVQSVQRQGREADVRILFRNIAPILTGLGIGLAIAGVLGWLAGLQEAFYVTCAGAVVVLVKAMIDATRANHLVGLLTRKWDEPTEKTGDQ